MQEYMRADKQAAWLSLQSSKQATIASNRAKVNREYDGLEWGRPTRVGVRVVGRRFNYSRDQRIKRQLISTTITDDAGDNADITLCGWKPR